MIAKDGAGFSDVTGAQRSRGISGLGIDAEIEESRAAGVGVQAAEHAGKAGQQILLTLVSNVISDLGADGGHGVTSGCQRSEITSLECAPAVQDHADLFIGSDLAGGQRGAIGQHLEVAGEVGFPERNVDEITTLGSVQLRHGLHHTGCQEGITQGGLLNNVRSKNLGDDDVRAKSRHDESPGMFTVWAQP